MVFDVTNRISFEKLDEWLQVIKDHVNFEDIEVILIGNKIDLVDSRIVST